MRHRLKDLLPFGKAKTPGFGISRQFYLSVLAPSPVLPAVAQLVNPKGVEGAIAGFGVPLRQDAGKEALTEPMRKGVYAVASPDQKTVLRLVVVGKEEAGFDPSGLLASPAGLLMDQEVRNRILAAWNILQLSFESHDPMVYPALDFLLDCADRLAALTEGAVADPISQVYRLPGGVQLPHDAGLPFSTLAHVQVKSKAGGHLFTLGMSKFGLHEFEIYEVSEEATPAGERLLLGLAQTCLKGKKAEPGDKVGHPKGLFRVAEGGLDRGQWDGIPCLELIPEAKGATSANILLWNAERD